MASSLYHKLEQTSSHDYMTAKGVSIHGAAITNNGTMAIPVHNYSGEIQTLQYIARDGNSDKFTKSFSRGAKRKEGVYIATPGLDPKKLLEGNEKVDHVILCEGVATSASIQESYKDSKEEVAVIAALSAPNMESIAVHIRQAYPTAAVTACCENDFGNRINAGREVANKLSQSQEVNVIFARAVAGKNISGFDFNDLAKESGFAEIKKQITNSLNLFKAKKRSELTRTNHKDITPTEQVKARTVNRGRSAIDRKELEL